MDIGKKYILFGAGYWGRQALKFFGKEKVLCFCDNNQRGIEIDGIKVIGPESLPEVERQGEVVITPVSYRQVIEISEQLKELRIPYRLFQEASEDVIQAEANEYIRLNERQSFGFEKNTSIYCAMDRLGQAGTVTQSFWEDLWAARHIYEKKPAMHYDIGSRIDSFISHLLTFGQKVTLIDVRPLGYDIGVDFIQADAANLDGIEDGTIESLSALCSLEHIGLGRYGDKIDPEGCFKCFDSIQKKMMAGGDIYISVPIGREHVEFNAHRVFRAETIKNAFDKCKLVEFSITDGNRIYTDVDLHKYDAEPDRGWKICGFFHFQRL